MGTVGADINSIDIVEKGHNGTVIDDFMVALPPGTMAETLISACSRLEGVEVLWLSRYPDQWGIESDIVVIQRMSGQPDQAAQILTHDAPQVFHCQWAVLVDADSGLSLDCSRLSPELNQQHLARLEPLQQAHTVELDEEWLPGWGELAVAVAPLTKGRVLVLGRQGGPAFLNSEVLRLAHLCMIAG